MKVLVSACLAGVRCRYDGNHNAVEAVLELVREGRALPVCPEQIGGLPTPRNPCEIVGGRVLDTEGVDCTEAFQRGAEECLKLAQLAGCTEAILKSCSPSCGSGEIYDGTFSGVRVPGDGLCAALFKKHGIAVKSELDL